MQETLAESLESALSQTVREFEIICINDGSTDASFDILKYYRRQDSRVQILTQENQGSAAARNRGITAASGKYISFLDADSLYADENALRDLVIAARDGKTKIAGGSLITLDDRTGKTTAAFREAFRGYTFPGDGLVFYEDYQFDFGFQRFIYDREMLLHKEIFFPPYRYFASPVFFVHAMSESKAFYALKRPTYVSRIGHKLPLWTPETIVDSLLGILGNLQAASDHGYADLYALTLNRLNPYLKKKIIFTRWGKSTEEINNTLAVIRSSNRHDLLVKSQYSFSRQGEDAVKDIQRSVRSRLIRAIAFVLYLRPVRAVMHSRHKRKLQDR
jgi:glycosyltransferase involved in cell wall biosynthesis